MILMKNERKKRFRLVIVLDAMRHAIRLPRESDAIADGGLIVYKIQIEDLRWMPV